MKCSALYFTAPGCVEVREEALPGPGPGQARVRVELTAISTGTEMMLYRGQFPRDIAVDENIPALQGEFSYPLKYGYSTVGVVEAPGPGVDPAWLGRRVFGFQPHVSHYVAPLGELLPIPDGIGAEDAVFLPNMETAVNLVMDGAPVIGERVMVFGQGIVGLLTTALLGSFPLASLVSADRFALRRRASLTLGAHASLDPANDLERELSRLHPQGADLVYELSGNAEVLDQAIAAAGYAGRVVVGSWYGQKPSTLHLGGRFHRSRIRLVSSQVSSLAPEFTARWTKSRRFDVAWEMLRRVQPARLITRRTPLADAPQAFHCLDASPEAEIQVVLTAGLH